MDSLLVLGAQDDQLCKFLTKMGYQLIQQDPQHAVPEILAKQTIDLMLFDTRSGFDSNALLDFLRGDDATRGIPVVCIADRPRTAYDLKERADDKLEIVTVPYKIGAVVSRIATRLRLRKMAGAEDAGASLAEVNAMLRDLTDRFQQQIEEAQRIQRSLLPAKLPSDERCEIVALYEPLEEVGGDWYFVEKDPSGGIHLQVADVTGHGLAAAFVGSMTKLALTASRQESPGGLLAAMNRLMSPQIPSGRFVTMISLRYDPSTGEVRCARAGNPPALVCRPSKGVVEELSPDGFAVGFFDDSTYEESVCTLEPGDVLAIFTDGIPEAQNRDNVMYGTKRLGETLLKFGGKSSVKEVITSVVEDFEQFCDERIVKDDITMLVLRRKR